MLSVNSAPAGDTITFTYRYVTYFLSVVWYLNVSTGTGQDESREDQQMRMTTPAMRPRIRTGREAKDSAAIFSLLDDII